MLVFDSKTHKYRHPDTNAEYISVTTLLGRYKKPFDVITASERVAKREGKTPEEVREQWKTINNNSKTYGSKIHSVIEEYNLSKNIVSGYESLIESYKKLNVIADDDKLLVEEQVYSHSYQLAGTVDIIRIEEKGGFSIFDIKTNKKFNFYSQYGEPLLYPVEHLSACEYSTYSLQLSLYALMYENLTGKRLNQLGIFYYDKDNNKFEYYPTNYMKSDVIKILNHYREN